MTILYPIRPEKLNILQIIPNTIRKPLEASVNLRSKKNDHIWLGIRIIHIVLSSTCYSVTMVPQTLHAESTNVCSPYSTNDCCQSVEINVTRSRLKMWESTASAREWLVSLGGEPIRAGKQNEMTHLIYFQSLCSIMSWEIFHFWKI